MTSAIICPACRAGGARTYAVPEGLIHCCPACDLQWADQSAATADHNLNLSLVNDHYMDPASLGSAYPPFVEFLDKLAAIKNCSMRILDVGCGNGRFLAEALGRGHDVMGVEIDRAMERLIPADILDRVVFSPIEDVKEFGKPFDVVTFWDSFEHLVDPLSVLRSLVPHLADNAVVFLRVNNSHDIFNIISKVALVLAPPIGLRLLRMCFNLPHHYWNFNPRAMDGLLSGVGWSIARHRVTETPISRLTSSPIPRLAIGAAYLVNKIIGGGKIGEYWIYRNDYPNLFSSGQEEV